ncbi:ENT domain protein [Medicago truncatula]|uniref:ENT domain protein n=1 Tax=Medicago truncatula TaxID=3880 RepID=G7L1J8_MEDTR|nr:ENT domain protein [Medicago truncatula]
MTDLLSSLITDPNGTRDAVNWENHIHSMEIQAYSSMLKAFIAQSELLTWGKEELLTELRKELNIADSEHGEILTKINSDDSIKWIREQRKMAYHSQAHDSIKANASGCTSTSIGNSTIRLQTHSHAQDYIKANTSGCPASIGNSTVKLQTHSHAQDYIKANTQAYDYIKANTSGCPASIGNSTVKLQTHSHAQDYIKANTQAYDNIKANSSGCPSASIGNSTVRLQTHSHAQDYIKANTQAYDYIKANTSGCPSASIGNSTVSLQTHSHAQDYIKANTTGCPSASIGNSVIRLKAPSSAAFYPQNNLSRSKASHSSIHIPASLPPKFNDNLLTAEFVHGNADQPKEMFNYDAQLPPIGRGNVPKQNDQFKQYFPPSKSVMLNNKSDLIQIRATDRVIQDVEKILFSREKPGPADIERAKQTLKEQEGALLEALGKLAGVLEEGNDQFLNSLFL